MNTEQEPQSQPLPIISNETLKRLMEEFSLAEDPPQIQTRQELEQFALRKAALPNPIPIQEEASVEVFRDLLSSNPNLVRSIYNTLQSNDATRGSDSVTLGMAIVLKAYDIETNYNLLSNFSKLADADIETFTTILQKSFSSPQGTIFEKVLNSQRIPEQHISLNEVIRKISRQSHYWSSSNVNIGAAAMFNSLGAMQSKLFLQGESQTQPPLQ